MNGLFQLGAAVLFLLWDRARMLRGPWRRKEWRNVAVQGFWFCLCLWFVVSGPILMIWLAWKLF